MLIKSEVFIDCKYAALLPIVSYFKMDIAEFLFDICYYYNYIQTQGVDSFGVNMFRMKTRKENLEDIGILQRDYFGSFNVVDVVIQAIDNETPIVVRVDLFYDNDALFYYQKIHWAHYLLIYGYDFAKKQFLIYDSVNGTDHHYITKTKSFMSVIEAYNGFIDFYINNKKLKKPTLMTFHEMTNKHEKMEICNFLNELDQKYMPKINDSLDAIKYFYEDIIHLVTSSQNVTYLKVIIDKLSQLCVSKRAIQYLQNIPSFYTFNRQHQTVVLNETLLQQSMRLRAVIAKYYYSGKLNQNFKKSVIFQCNIIKENEQEFYRLLQR